MHAPARIFLVDDDPQDVELSLLALQKAQPGIQVTVAEDGEAALALLLGSGDQEKPPLPAAIFMDLKMPRLDGLEVLRRLRREPRLKSVPVIMLTSSQEKRDIDASYFFGANAYVVKPVDFKQFMQTMACLAAFWTQHNKAPLPT
jgi:CheY-like chemotaxis protein